MKIYLWRRTFDSAYISSRSVFSFLMTAPSFSIRISLHYPSIPKVLSCYQRPDNYQHGLMDNSTTEPYIELTENDFKTRYRNHTAHSISWRILSSSSPYNSASKRCNLCVKDKFLVICRSELPSLNERNELVSSCRHRNKALLRKS